MLAGPSNMTWKVFELAMLALEKCLRRTKGAWRKLVVVEVEPDGEGLQTITSSDQNFELEIRWLNEGLVGGFTIDTVIYVPSADLLEMNQKNIMLYPA
jgi:hypothetical protein